MSNFEIKNTLEGNQQLDENALYFVDWSKLQKVEDLIMILASIGFTFSPKHPHIELIKPFLNTEQPVYPGNQPQPKEIKLPNLKRRDDGGQQ